MKVLLKKYKKKIRKISIPIVMLFISSAAQASCSKLAKAAGMSQVKLEKIVKKLVKIESTSGKYNVKNQCKWCVWTISDHPKYCKILC